jgi:multidrug efflux pump
LLQARWLVIGVMLLCAGIIGLVWPTMKSELSPLEDRGTILATSTRRTAPRWTTPTATPRRWSASASQYPEFDRIFANLGNPSVSQGNVQYRAVDWDERKRSTWTSRARWRPSSTRCRASTPSRSRRRRWARASASGR